MRYPTIMNNTFKLENSFLNPDGRRTYTVLFNNTAMNNTVQVPYLILVNQTVNVTRLQNVSVVVFNSSTRRNQTVW